MHFITIAPFPLGIEHMTIGCFYVTYLIEYSAHFFSTKVMMKYCPRTILGRYFRMD